LKSALNSNSDRLPAHFHEVNKNFVENVVTPLVGLRVK